MSSERQEVATRIIETPVGRLVIAATEEGLTHVKVEGSSQRCPMADGGESEAARRHLDTAARALGEYFAGARKDFDDLVLAPEGTRFQRRVWKALRAIPHGATTSYGELATQIGRPGAARAVGLANGRNPIGIIVPCHRVIGADGSLTGYGGGLPMKAWLLEHEGSLGPSLFGSSSRGTGAGASANKGEAD